MSNPDWSRDEHILALDFYIRHRPHIPGKESDKIQQLSQLLNVLSQKILGDTDRTFRNPSGVYMKLMNFRRFDPNYSGVGLAHGNKDEEVVWNLYAESPEKLRKLSEHISSFADNIDSDITNAINTIEDEEEGNEGRILSRVHHYRERNRGLVSRKKKSFLKKHNSLLCEACGFDFENTYGERGSDFIECHHIKPVSELETNEKTKLSDLVLLCSNCHRIVHRKKPWLSFVELKSLVQ